MGRRETGRNRDRGVGVDAGRAEAQAALYGAPKRSEGRSEVQEESEDARQLSGAYRPRPARPVEHLRVPPHSIEAEQAVVGAVLLRPESYWETSLLVKPADFYRRDHQLIWQTVGTMLERQARTGEEVVDAVTLGAELEAMGLQEIVPSGYLVQLAANTPSAANAAAYARIVAEGATMRRLITVGTEIVNDGFEPGGRTSEEIMSTSMAKLEAANPRLDADGAVVRDVAGAVFKTMQERLEWDHDRLPGLRFGFPTIEEICRGLEPERTYGFGGRAKMGKSIILENIATNVAEGEEEGDVLVFTLEMSKSQWVNRMIAHVSGVQYEKLMRPKLLSDEDWSRLTPAFKLVRDLPIKIFDQSATIEEITARAVMHGKRRKVKLIVVDYLQLVKASEKKERRDLEVGHASWGLKELSKRVFAPVVYGFQINRGNEQGALVRPPRPSDSRESGNIEQDLDFMALLHRPGYYDKKSKGCRCEIALNRDGATGVFELEDQLDRSRFIDTGREWHDGQTNEQRKQDRRHDETGF